MQQVRSNLDTVSMVNSIEPTSQQCKALVKAVGLKTGWYQEVQSRGQVSIVAAMKRRDQKRHKSESGSGPPGAGLAGARGVRGAPRL